MPKHIPFYPELLEEEATTNEILLYGLIEVLSFSEGFCYASSDFMAEHIGVTVGTVKNLLSKISKKGWIAVEVEGNKRIAITPLLGLSVKKKGAKNSVIQELRSVENSSESVTEKLRYRHSGITVPSSQNDAQNREETGKGVINNNKDIKENKEKNDTTAGLAGNGPASRLHIKREEFESDEDFENEFYKRNTIRLGAN